MEDITACAVCGEGNFSHWMKCKDHTVSGEFFNIDKCNSCGFVFTNPRPLLEDLGNYYKAEAYISHTDSSKGIVNKLYKLVRKTTLRKKYNLVREFLLGKTLLDIGAGTGAFLNYCKEQGQTVFGVEPDPDARKVAKDTYGIIEVPEEAMNSWGEGYFSVITMWHVLEHVPKLNDRIQDIKRLLSDEGRLFIAVPNHLSRDAVHYGSVWAAYDVPRHLSHFTPETIERLFGNNGFVLEKMLPMKFDAFYVSMLSEKYKTGSSGVIIGAIQGFLSNLTANKGRWSSQIYVFKKNEAKTPSV